jgi:histidinol-phosphate aminotransferase
MPDLPPRIDIPTFWREQNAIYLHLGENPFPPTEGVLQSIASTAQNVNRYPDTNCIALREKLASYVGNNIESKHIIVGNGSDELIDLATVAFLNEGDCIATFEPSFFVYRFSAQRHNNNVVRIQRDENYDLPSESKLRPQLQNEPALTFIANPNNPTGTLTSRDDLIAVLNCLPGTKVVDECYFEFCNETVVDLIHERDDLIVFRSLSKCFGLAGLRVGYAIACEALIERMASFALTFPVNAIAQAAAIAALNEVHEMTQRVEQLIEQREKLAQVTNALGAKTIPSHANFILTLWNKESDLATKLRECRIFVSNQTANIGCEQIALRIGVGTPQENQKLIEALNRLNL